MTTLNADMMRLIQRGAKAEKHSKAIERLIINFIVFVITTFFGGWMVMLAAGVIHYEWIPALPTIGYWWAVLLVLLLRGRFSRLNFTNREQK